MKTKASTIKMWCNPSVDDKSARTEELVSLSAWNVHYCL